MAVRSQERSNDKTDEQREIDALLNYRPLSQLLRNWDPVGFIADGKSGSVFQVKNRASGLLAAMKFSASPKRLVDCAPPDSDADYLNRNDHDDNCHEVSMMNRLQGKPHIIPFIDRPEFLKYTFQNRSGEKVCQYAVLIVMPLCMNNAVWMPQVIASPEGRMKLALHVSMALVGYESEGIRHRDIKPGNILYSYDGNFYLSDAGEAKAQSEKTTVGLRGTYAYMAPEVFQLNGQSLHRADPRSDIYSLGIVLYQIFNDGQLPFRDQEGYLTDDAVKSLGRARQAIPERTKMKLRDHEQLAIELRQSGHMPPPPAQADAEIAAIILRCCAFAPEHRYQDAQNLYLDLDDYCRRHAINAEAFHIASQIQQGAEKGKSFNKAAVAGCCAALVALLGAGAAIWLSAPEQTAPTAVVITAEPTEVPAYTQEPTAAPTAVPTAAPTAVPTEVPTAVPTAEPTSVATPVPTAVPTTVPTEVPTEVPTAVPTAEPTPVPTPVPTAIPTEAPTPVPTAVPTDTPVPTAVPTPVPTATPTAEPTPVPTPVPTAVPTATPAPTAVTLEGLRGLYAIPSSMLMSFDSAMNTEVYTGPGTAYTRAASGRASVSSGGEIWCYGRVGNWYLVEYKVTAGSHKGSYRRGYMNGAAVKVSFRGNETEIPQANLPVTIIKKTGITDEPYKGRKNLCTLRKGDEATLLFFDGEDACIEVADSSAGLIQGYVPISCIELQN